METNKLRNIVVLNNLPSNIVEEAIIVLKKNAQIQRTKKTESNDKQKIESNRKSKDYILKEAEMLVNTYVSKLENKNKKINEKKMKDKYKKLKRYSTLITIGAILELMIIIL